MHAHFLSSSWELFYFSVTRVNVKGHIYSLFYISGSNTDTLKNILLPQTNVYAVLSNNRERVGAVEHAETRRQSSFLFLACLCPREFSRSRSRSLSSLERLLRGLWYFIYIFVEISTLECARLSVLILDEPGTTCPPFPVAMTQSVRRNRSFIIVYTMGL